jgi:hypothetical protein
MFETNLYILLDLSQYYRYLRARVITVHCDVKFAQNQKAKEQNMMKCSTPPTLEIWFNEMSHFDEPSLIMLIFMT